MYNNDNNDNYNNDKIIIIVMIIIIIITILIMTMTSIIVMIKLILIDNDYSVVPLLDQSRIVYYICNLCTRVSIRSRKCEQKSANTNERKYKLFVRGW